MDNPMTRLLGIRHPIMQGGMQWVGTAELAAAVSNAGALGTLSALTQPTPQALGEEIDRCRRLTDAPFCVNITMLRTSSPPPYEAIFDTVVQREVPVVETAGNIPQALFERLLRAGIKVVHKCTSLRHARSAEAQGVHLISMDGFECAGHPGEDDVPGLVLVPMAAAALRTPVIACGGIANGRGMAAALALGACGVTMGTRFVATQEAPVHARIKEALVKAAATDTRLILRTLRNTARVLANATSQAVLELERRPDGADFETLRPLVAGTRGRAALESGAVDDGLVWAGQSVGLIHDIPSCAELVARTMRECADSLAQAGARLPRA